MKTRIVLAFLLVMLCSACNTMPVQPATPTEADAATAYIHAVENNAFGTATRVIWVNPPRNKDLEDKGD